MALTYNRQSREMSLKGQITLNNGETILLTMGDVLNYNCSSSIGGEGLPLGGTEASSFSLELDNSHRRYYADMFDNAEVHMFIGIKDASDGQLTWSDFGVWYVDDTSAPEQGVSITLSGCDALASKFASKYADGGSYPCSLYTLLRRVTPVAITLARNNFPNASVQIARQPEWDEGVTARDIVSYIAIAAGGFARIERNGKLNIVGYSEHQTYNLNGDVYKTFTPSGGSAFRFNCIEAENSDDAPWHVDDEDLEYVRFAVDSTIEDDPTNCIQISYNPILTTEIVSSVRTELNTAFGSTTVESAELSWVGDPAVMVGDMLNITDLRNESYQVVILSQSMTFNGGLSSSESCHMPSINNSTSPSYSTSSGIMTAGGKIRATKISGLDEQVIYATSGYIGNLTSETIATDTLTANLIRAANLLADKIDAKIIKAESITSDQIHAGAVTADKADISSITAGVIQSQEIHTEIVNAATAAIGTADISYAKIKDASVQTLFTYDGNADKYYIKKLGVTSAQILNLMVGNLVFKASDGNFYQLDASTASDGTVSFAPSVYTGTVDEDTGITGDGQRYVFEDTIDVEELYAANIHAADAIITKLTVDKLYANEAFINTLKTKDIWTDSVLQASVKDEITGEVNTYVRLNGDGIQVGKTDSASKVQIDNDSVDINTGDSSMSASFQGDRIQFGNYELRKSADGGLVFKMKEA